MRSHCDGRNGIIPAGTGSTRYRGGGWCVSGDHPRGYGEHHALEYHPQGGTGSSPRVRGAQCRCELRWTGRGIIPAGTGSTMYSVGTFEMLWDHPRGYGEHLSGVHGERVVRGSSPRVRGARGRWPVRPTVNGIIPAGTGSTLATSMLPGFHRDHPRGYGEHRARARNLAPRQGSSPRVRGALIGVSHMTINRGIIPAGTGSTIFSASPLSSNWDHPRGYGEHSSESVT